METLQWATMDKSKWGPGPWQTEPDKKQWLDDATGYPCIIRRGGVMGQWCGYVGIPESHPLHGLDFDARPKALAKQWLKEMKKPIGQKGVIPLFLQAMGDEDDNPRLDCVFDVHGSITFAGACKPHGDEATDICHKTEGNDNVWWFGFDCGHCDDYQPGMIALLNECGSEGGISKFYKAENYKDINFVIEQTLSLAKQLKEVANG